MAVVSRYVVALHILSWIAQKIEDNDNFVTSDRIAKSVNTSPVFIRRVLKSLHDANLVIVQHGGSTPAPDGSLLSIRNPSPYGMSMRLLWKSRSSNFITVRRIRNV
jgi:predicted transcriptional regulator